MFFLIWLILPLALAAGPGCILLLGRRWVSGGLLLAGAIIAIACPLYLDRLASERITAQGGTADSLAFLFLPWMSGVPFALVASLIAAVIAMIAKKNSTHE